MYWWAPRIIKKAIKIDCAAKSIKTNNNIKYININKFLFSEIPFNGQKHENHNHNFHNYQHMRVDLERCKNCLTLKINISTQIRHTKNKNCFHSNSVLWCSEIDKHWIKVEIHNLVLNYFTQLKGLWIKRMNFCQGNYADDTSNKTYSAYGVIEVLHRLLVLLCEP